MYAVSYRIKKNEIAKKNRDFFREYFLKKNFLFCTIFRKRFKINTKSFFLLLENHEIKKIVFRRVSDKRPFYSQNQRLLSTSSSTVRTTAKQYHIKNEALY